MNLDTREKAGYTLDIRDMIIQGGVFMVTQVKTWGNSQGVRLSKEILRNAGIGNNDFLSIELLDGNIVLKKTFKHRTLEERAAEFNGKIGPYDEYDWGQSHGRERW